MGGFDWRKCALLQYLALRILERRHSGLVRILQACFASKATLKACISRTPRPPTPLGVVILSHATQHIFLWSGEASHQNLVSTVWILLHKLTGNSKHVIAKEGTAVSTAFNMTSLPALESCRDAQLTAFCLIRSTILV